MAFAGYGYALYGPVPIVQYLVVIWGGPMTIWSMKGGFSGLCSLPICLLATLWNISQLDVIVGLFLSTTCLDWIQLRPVWSRLLTLLLSIAYLYARGSPVFARSSTLFLHSIALPKQALAFSLQSYPI